MHFVDLALVAAWMEYKKDFTELKVPKREILDSLNFRVEVANTLIKAQSCHVMVNAETTPKLRGRPSLIKRSLSRQPLQENSPTSFSNSPATSVSSLLEPSEENTQIKRRRSIQTYPEKEIRLDNIMHIPEFVNSKNNSRCKLEGCKGKTFVICKKCDVYLCLKRDSNCFARFHQKL